MKNKRPGISNIYIFESVDRDGNVDDIKFGMNLMTNTGFNAIYKTGSAFALSDSVKLYVGAGHSNFDKTIAYIETPLFGGLAATNKTTAKDYAYPIMFSRGTADDTGIVTLISRFGIVEYDFNITNYDFDQPISEYGIGTSNNALWTHSHIYDNEGNATQITKKKNHKLIIYCYMCMSFYEHVIMDNWANGIYLAITTNAIMYQKMFESNIYTYKRGNVVVDRTSGRQQSYNDVLTPQDIQDGIDSIIRNTTVAPPFTIWSQKGHDSGYFDGFIYKAPGFIAIDPEFLPTPETFSIPTYTSENMLKSTGFSDKFGRSITDDSYNKTVYPTFTTMFDVSVNTYNYNTSAWDNSCPFVNDNDTHYTNAGLETNYCLPLYYWANGAIQTAYLYQNIDTTNDILKIGQGHSFLMACDKYWDQSTWINITDFENIPAGAKRCRYWIAGSNSINIVPTRATAAFELLDAPGGTNGYRTFQQSAFNLDHIGAWPSAESTDTNCIVIGGKICALNRLYGFSFASNSLDMANFTYGKWLISFRSVNNSINTVDMSGLNAAEPDTSVLSVTRALEFSTNVNAFSQTYRTENGNGLICIQSLTSTQEAIILDISGNTITSSLHQWMRSCCIYGTDYIAYEPNTADGYIHIYKMSTGADVGSNIELPSGFTISAMFGNGNDLWFYNGTNTYHVDITSATRTLEACNNINPVTFANSYRLQLSHVTGVTMLLDQRINSSTLADVYYATAESPTNFGNFSAFYVRNIGENRFRYCKLKFINNNTLVALIVLSETGRWNPSTANDSIWYIADLGQYIRTGKAYSNNGIVSDDFNGIYFYGESLFYNGYYLYPAVNALQIKLDGKTRTITTFNHTKRISGKEYEIGFTNMPLWGLEVNGSGKPLGTPTPELNENGQIIGWSW